MGAGLGGGSQTVFGGRGSQTFLGKVTSISAGIFMVTSVTLAYHASKTSSVVEREAPAPAAPAPFAPAGGSPTGSPPNAPASTPSQPGPAQSAPAAPAQPAPAAPGKSH
jgi:preprotein translocase subunit SecG